MWILNDILRFLYYFSFHFLIGVFSFSWSFSFLFVILFLLGYHLDLDLLQLFELSCVILRGETMMIFFSFFI